MDALPSVGSMECMKSIQKLSSFDKDQLSEPILPFCYSFWTYVSNRFQALNWSMKRWSFGSRRVLLGMKMESHYRQLVRVGQYILLWWAMLFYLRHHLCGHTQRTLLWMAMALWPHTHTHKHSSGSMKSCGGREWQVVFDMWVSARHVQVRVNR